MALTCTIPGKTFLVGEYLALHGGPTLSVLSKPCFEMTSKPGNGSYSGDAGGQARWGGIHPDSPAGKFISAHSDYFKNIDLSFSDPYKGMGGFGASTAQFLGAYALWMYREAHSIGMEAQFDFRHLLAEYQQYAWNGEGTPPSGADLIAQFKGSMTFFEKRKGIVSVTNWPFEELDFYLIHTGNKVATHEHLKTLKDFDSLGLEKAAYRVQESFASANPDELIAGVQDYAKALKDLNFTCEPTLKLLEGLRGLSFVKAAKGCGALGADVLFVVTAKNHSAELEKYCQTVNVKLVASNKTIATGLQVEAV
ncbi:hypothetical protein B9G69_015265 [Bdellovibrio sp. SKB1291214]|uniref:hypothetical protein n=1 Tax=Bdellovibrio sp. SKB1291214 TaxID=1732569 RepID=UPI000B514D37|nr:hypothetical protein [Bdellovibrio sp. SKB1291214]UYL08401.1 hypothetical protein B9G69_015265 [Bdellovibrio sp. SKB1291214]